MAPQKGFESELEKYSDFRLVQHLVYVKAPSLVGLMVLRMGGC